MKRALDINDHVRSWPKQTRSQQRGFASVEEDAGEILTEISPTGIGLSGHDEFMSTRLSPP